ncbi:M15 family metallopeptidase [Gelidibacter maritimus]|uniref:M15 family metallopeptidase n=1 Tax=Gelidibacter maritimus TaxID=2761487 RepID=A0A7W2M5Z1_9FLAO|nr:M15 family metallopeptidase [Gelidibacter maritimus]MBA6153331.1 M15 family metallopeptidase [Gelidibacter maritimus]
MNRKDFIKTIALSSAAMGILPQFAFQSTDLSYKELIGKGNPSLFGDGFQIRTEAFDAFTKMRNAALKDNISIQVVSSYRNFAHQNRIWERKYKNFTQQGLSPVKAIQKIIEYSTVPGTSRHHWGTDMDIIDANVAQPKNVLSPSHFEGNGSYVKLKKWMDANSKDYGFYIVYTDKPGRKGFKYEPWHYSYRPLSCDYLRSYRKLNLKDILKNELLMGHQHLTDSFLERYYAENILDINPELL